jgi:hypothetical protein
VVDYADRTGVVIEFGTGCSWVASEVEVEVVVNGAVGSMVENREVEVAAEGKGAKTISKRFPNAIRNSCRSYVVRISRSTRANLIVSADSRATVTVSFPLAATLHVPSTPAQRHNGLSRRQEEIP